ncbi:MAG: GLPGLI family protein, partial [Capnocytophaga sp.]|nr:GLPGLI family protein [Capnocytophaga sp.]
IYAMKKILMFFLILSFTVSFAQNSAVTQITYTHNFDFGMPGHKISKLLFTATESHYVDGIAIPGEPKEGNAKIIRYEHGKFKEIFSRHITDNILTTKAKLHEKFYLATEELPKINWEIQHGKKATIMGMECTQAKGSFRGRSYTVWFTPEIPVPFGPWKLGGLPGLILEASDDLGGATFVADKIEKLQSINNFNFGFPDDPEKFTAVSLREFITAEDSYHAEVVDAIIAKMPKGSKISNQKKMPRGGLELKYEWEE